MGEKLENGQFGETDLRVTLLRIKETCVNRIGKVLETSGPKVENLAKYGSGFGTSEFDFGQAGKNSKRWPNATKIGMPVEKHTYF